MSGRAKKRNGLLVLRLYVAGDSPNSVAARSNLEAVLARLPEGSATLEIVNVLGDPIRGLRDRVLITPTLIKVAPAPERRVIGNLRDRAALLAGLGVVDGAHE